jgi:hypothetical protein
MMGWRYAGQHTLENARVCLKLGHDNSFHILYSVLFILTVLPFDAL